MSTAATGTVETGSVDPAESVLRDPADTLDLLIYAESRQLELALGWAHLHPGDEVEFAIADLALTLGLSTDSGRNLVGDAVELYHRLPRLWDRTMTGEVRVWKARKIAQATRALGPEAAAYVDQHLARVAHTCSYAQVERTIERAKAEHDPATLEADRQRAADDLYVRVRTGDLTTDGKVYIDALVDLPTALAF